LFQKLFTLLGHSFDALSGRYAADLTLGLRHGVVHADQAYCSRPMSLSDRGNNSHVAGLSFRGFLTKLQQASVAFANGAATSPCATSPRDSGAGCPGPELRRRCGRDRL
jgi:hypothetical protein